MNKIKVRISKSYGNERIYPVCDKAEIFARLANRTCLSRQNIRDIKALGFEIETEQKTV